MNFATALDWINNRNFITQPFGLHRMEYLMEKLENPQYDVPCVLIGGTNGKGSVTALLDSIVSAGGFYRTGYTVSPHLASITERICIQNKPMREALWIKGIELIQKATKLADQEPSIGPPSFFEIVTALALWGFRESELDLAFVEVGLGGRLDATNIVHPEISVITNIGTDHKELLGPDKPSIAKEKLGITRPKVPLVTGEQDPAILALFEEETSQKNIPLHKVYPEKGFKLSESTARGHKIILDGLEGEIFFPLAGDHQLINLSTALEVVNILRSHGFEVSTESIAKGIKSVKWPGRLDWRNTTPPVLLDGAHNNEALSALIAYLKKFPPPRPLHVIFGALKNKPAAEMANALSAMADSFAYVSPPTPRAISDEEIEAILAQNSATRKYDNLKDALLAGADAGSILITGSLYLVGEYLRQIG